MFVLPILLWIIDNDEILNTKILLEDGEGNENEDKKIGWIKQQLLVEIKLNIDLVGWVRV